MGINKVWVVIEKLLRWDSYMPHVVLAHSPKSTKEGEDEEAHLCARSKFSHVVSTCENHCHVFWLLSEDGVSGLPISPVLPHFFLLLPITFYLSVIISNLA
jgi:hypothetical protein